MMTVSKKPADCRRPEKVLGCGVSQPESKTAHNKASSAATPERLEEEETTLAIMGDCWNAAADTRAP
jgi:hypothetical protein